MSAYKLVTLANGVCSVHSTEYKETFHPVIGPVAEAEALYARQLQLVERLSRHKGEFVVWDVGLGAAANALTVLRCTREIPSQIHILSFDKTLEPLEFALNYTQALGYMDGYEGPLMSLLAEPGTPESAGIPASRSDSSKLAGTDAGARRQGHHCTCFKNGRQHVKWEVLVGDFPSLISTPAARNFPKPHAIMFDAFSPATNPEMWTAPLFTNLYGLLDPQRPCGLPTYSRSTMLRVTLLLAGFYVGVGHATGEKEETTIAANTIELIAEPLDHRWLARARRSNSAEPMWEPVYRQTRLSSATWERLQDHRQFAMG